MFKAFQLFREYVPIVLIGLQNAGKTTFVLRLKEGRFRRPKPTVGISFEQITIGDVNFTVFDLSGQKSFRQALWKSYVLSSYGIIFMLDSSDVKSLKEAKKWYWTVIDSWLKDILSDKVVLFLANKSDLKASQPLDVIIEKLDLMKMSMYPNISFQIFKTSLRTGDNVNYAVTWFVNKLKKLVENLLWKPKAFLLCDNAGNVIYSFATEKEIELNDLFAGYLKALSKFSDELVGEVIVKVIRTEEWYSVVVQENNFLLSVFVEEERFLPEARRIGLIILNYIKENNWHVAPEKLDKYIKQLLS